MTGKVLPTSTTKSSTRLLTFSGFFRDAQKASHGKRCVTLIETPQMFSDTDVVDVGSEIGRRCFDLILVGIRPKSGSGFEVMLPQEKEVLVSLLGLLESIYRETFWKSLAFVLFKDASKGPNFYLIT